MEQSGASQPVADRPAASSPGARRWRWLLGVGVAVAVYTGVVGAWLPGFVRPRLEVAVHAALGTPVHLGELRLNPWTLTVAVADVRLGSDAAPWFTLQRAEARLSLESLWRLAPVVSKLNLLAPRVFIERLGPGRLNISPMLDHLRAQPASPAGSEAAHFALYNIAVRDGELRYADELLQQTHRVANIQLTLPFISNLPSLVKVEVEPALSALVDGSPLLVKGRSQPFAQGRTSEVELSWRQVALKPLAEAARPFLPPAWQMSVPDGQLDTTLTLNFEERAAPAVSSLVLRGGLTVSKLALQARAWPGLGPLDAGWSTLRIQGIEARPLERQIKLGRVLLDGLRLTLRPLAPAPAPPILAARLDAKVPKPTAGVAPAWQWHVEELRLSAPLIDAQTELAAPWPGLRELQLHAKGLDGGARAAPATWQIAWQDSQGGTVKAEGDVQVAQAKAHAQLAVTQLALLPWMAPVAQRPAVRELPLQVRAGTLDLHLQVAAQWAPAEAWTLTLSQGDLAFHQVQARASQAMSSDQLAWQALTLTGLQATVQAQGLQNLQLAAVTLQGLDARLSRDAQGRVLGFGGAAPAAGSRTVPAPAAGPSASSAAHGTSPTVAITTLRCQACQLSFTDQTVSPAAKLVFKQTELSVQGLSQDLGKQLNVDLATRAQGQGQLSLHGQVRPTPLQVQAQLGVKNLDLRVLQSYIDPLVNISLAAVKAQAQGHLQLDDDPRHGLKARYQGGVGLTDLRVLDRLDETDVLNWKALNLQGMDVAWQATGALDAALGRISLQDFYGRVIINPNGQLNLASILRHEAGGPTQSVSTPQTAEASASAPVPVASEPASPERTPHIRWDQIQLSRGRVDFTDNFIKPNYSAELTQVAGEISAVSSANSQPATVKVSGALDDGSPLLITGQINPLGPRLFTDIEGTAKGIELTRLTPYAARYTGYAIEKGTLSVKVHYKVDGGKLQGDNQIFLDQLTFGDKVESPDATSLPVRLAVSLLQNSRGEIDVNLPISGSLDEPEFSVGGLVWRVLVNLINKAVTAPFALLSGGGSEELGFVPFAPGSADLSASARKALDTLASKLSDRPGLKLEATGRADPLSDADGLRRQHVDELIRSAKARATGQDEAEVQVDPAERDTWLAAAYKAADIKKPRNLLGMAKTLPPADMQALLARSTPADQAALLDLADRRADQVKAYLAARMPPERVLLTASKLGGEGLPQDQGPPSRVQFEVR